MPVSERYERHFVESKSKLSNKLQRVQVISRRRRTNSQDGRLSASNPVHFVTLEFHRRQSQQLIDEGWLQPEAGGVILVGPSENRLT